MQNKKPAIFSNKSMTKIVLLAIVLTAACSALTGFNRNTAVKLLEKDTRWGAPLTMTIDIGWKLTNAGAGISQKTADETAEQAVPRVRDDFMQRHPQLIVAEELGYIVLHFENGKLGERPMGAPRFDDKLGYWTFRARAEITDKGRKLWTDLNLNVDEENLPFASRSEPEITGLKDENQTTKRADFTFRWKPNELGEAFDPASSRFKQLAENLREALAKIQQNIYGGGSNNIADFSSTRKGIAYFQKFDDGWRISNLSFF